MEHIPLIEGSQLQDFKVPFVCEDVGDDFEYDGLGFVDFPVRKGWATEEDQYAWLKCPTRELAIRAQSWLYFGLLAVYLGESVDNVKQHFVRQQQGSPAETLRNPSTLEAHINTSNLESLIYARLRYLTHPPKKASHESRLSPELYRAAMNQVSTEAAEPSIRNAVFDYAMFCCDSATGHVEPFDELSASLVDQDTYEGDAAVRSLMVIAHSIKLLIEALSRAHQHYCRSISAAKSARTQTVFGIFARRGGVGGEYDVEYLIPRIKCPEMSKLVYKFAKEGAWCSFQTRRFAAHLSTTSMCYLLSLQNPGTAGFPHRHCPSSGDECIANHAVRETYITRHSGDCSSCQGQGASNSSETCNMKGVDTNQLVAIIKDGFTPLLEFTTSQSGAVGLTVVRGTPDDKYIGISQYVVSDFPPLYFCFHSRV
jgi:hypothetical protein